MELRSIKKLPSGMFGASCRISELKSIKPKAPKKPMAIPTIFFGSTFSLIRIADKKTTIMGVVVIRTALLIGVDSERPLKNTNILKPMPNRAQTNIRA